MLIAMTASAVFLFLSSWTSLTPLPHPTWFLFQDPVAIDGRMHVVAGGQIWRYDPASDKWDVLRAPLQSSRVHHSLAAFGGRLYAIGGSKGELGPQSTVESYDFAEGTWRLRAPLPGPRRDATALVAGDRIYLLGGFDKTNQPLPILVYDAVHDAWDTGQSVSKALQCWGAHWIGGRIYILGSQENVPRSSVLEVYDPVADTIIQKRPLEWPRNEYATAVLGDRIYALGGRLTKFDEPTSSVDVYDPVTDEWTKVADLPKAKSWAGALGIGTKIYVMGGVQTEWARPENAVDVLDLGTRASP